MILTEGKKYVAVTDQRPAQLLPSLLICLAPFPVGPVPLGAYQMSSSSLHMLKGLDVPLYTGRPHRGRILKMWPHQHYKGSLLGLSASAMHGSPQLTAVLLFCHPRWPRTNHVVTVTV